MSDSTKDGGLAFPAQPIYHFPDGVQLVMERGGMSLRDYFAAKVLPSVVIQCSGDTIYNISKADYFAGRSYELADAMLKARSA